MSYDYTFRTENVHVTWQVNVVVQLLHNNEAVCFVAIWLAYLLYFIVKGALYYFIATRSLCKSRRLYSTLFCDMYHHHPLENTIAYTVVTAKREHPDQFSSILIYNSNSMPYRGGEEDDYFGGTLFNDFFW